MEKELLDSFLFIKVDSGILLFPTERTLELTGCKDYRRIPWFIEKEALVSYIETEEKMKIDGAIRISGGNNHDATFDTEVIIVNGGGAWKEELDKYRKKSATVKDVEEFSEEIKQEWRFEYDLSCCGEWKRVLYCSSKTCERVSYTFNRVYGSPSDFRHKEHGLSRGFMYLEKRTEK